MCRVHKKEFLMNFQTIQSPETLIFKGFWDFLIFLKRDFIFLK